MIDKRILCPERVRKIEGSFAFVEHRFLRDGFWVSLSHDELLLYLLLVMAADRAGLSYYGYDKLCTTSVPACRRIHCCQERTYRQGPHRR